MALKEDRQIFETNVQFASSGTMERGGVASIIPWQDGLVYYAAGSGQKPAGIALDDIEALNPMKHPEYLQRNVSPVGGAIGLVTRGEIKTDMLDSDNDTYKAGDDLYLIGSGKITNIVSAVGTLDVRVGTCLSAKDSHGFIKMRVEL